MANASATGSPARVVAGDAQVSDSQQRTPVPVTSDSSASTSARQGIVSIASTSAPASASTANRGRCQARSWATVSP